MWCCALPWSALEQHHPGHCRPGPGWSWAGMRCHRRRSPRRRSLGQGWHWLRRALHAHAQGSEGPTFTTLVACVAPPHPSCAMLLQHNNSRDTPQPCRVSSPTPQHLRWLRQCAPASRRARGRFARHRGDPGRAGQAAPAGETPTAAPQRTVSIGVRYTHAGRECLEAAPGHALVLVEHLPNHRRALARSDVSQTQRPLPMQHRQGWC